MGKALGRQPTCPPCGRTLEDCDMAIPLAPDDLLEVKLYTSQRQQLGLQVWHVTWTEAAPGTDLEDVATAYDLLFGTAIKLGIGTTASYVAVGIRRLKSLPSIEVFNATTAGLGSLTGDPLPRQTAGVVTLRTNRPGRSYRGRKYLPFPTENVSDGNALPTATYLLFLDTWGTLLNTPVAVTGATIGSGTATTVIYSKVLNSWTAITSYRVNPRWGTQRRRSDYGRLNPIVP